MRRFTRPLCLVAVLGLEFLSPARARAGPVIQGGAETSIGSLYNANFMQGYDFVSTTDQFLTALGFWDQGANGLPRGFQVGLWNTATQTLLASAVIDSADPIDPTVTVAGGNYRYETLAAPVALTAGTTYTLAWQTGSPDLSTTDSLFVNYPTLVTDPNVTVANQSRFLATDGFTFPTGTFVPNTLFRGQVNALLTAAAVPEPASAVLLGLGAAGLAARRVRRRA